MKKWICLALTFAMLMTLCAAASAETYTASEKGFGGDVTVSVTIEDGKITAVTAAGDKETVGVGSVALEKLPEQIVKAQSVAVDAVASATITSKALLSAARSCVAQAGMEEQFSVKAEKTASTDVTRYDADVIVVGGGLSGMAAAVAAANDGANVFLLEKLAMTGGSAKASKGSFMVAELPENGFNVSGGEDTLEAALARWKEKQDSNSRRESMYPDYERLAEMLVESGKTLAWMEEFGATYTAGASIAEKGMLMLQANLDGDEHATMAARIMDKFKAVAVEKGATVMTSTAAHDLILDGDKVIGVKATNEDGEIEVYGDAVILACGGFLGNDEMVAAYLPEIYSVTSIACVGNTGDGFKMALDAGAQLLEKQWINPAWIAPRKDFVAVNPLANVFQDSNSPLSISESSYKRLGVNKEGKRYQNEAAQYAKQVLDLAYGGEQPYYALYDNLDETVMQIAESGIACGAVIKGETLEELAKNAGFDTDTFLATVARYNALCEKGVDEDFGKDASNMIAYGDAGPYYLVEMTPSGSDTLGGVKTNDHFEALNAEGQPIDGLYAVGSMSSGVFYNQYYFSGSALTFAATSGRLAGAYAAQNLSK